MCCILKTAFEDYLFYLYLFIIPFRKQEPISQQLFLRKIQMDNSLEFVEEESPKGSKVREALPSCLLFQTNISEVLSDDADDANFVFFFKGAMPIQCG